MYRKINISMGSIPEKIKRRAYVVAGTLALVMGVVGIIVPVLPTTPFLLLAAVCYMRGSQRLYNLLLYNRFIGTYIKDYLEGRGMSMKMKVWTIGSLWFAIIISAILITDSTIIRVLLAFVLFGVTVHILKIRTSRKDDSISDKIQKRAL